MRAAVVAAHGPSERTASGRAKTSHAQTPTWMDERKRAGVSTSVRAFCEARHLWRLALGAPGARRALASLEPCLMDGGGPGRKSKYRSHVTGVYLLEAAEQK